MAYTLKTSGITKPQDFVGKTVYEINNNLKNRWVRLYKFAKRIIQGIPNTLLNKKTDI